MLDRAIVGIVLLSRLLLEQGERRMTYEEKLDEALEWQKQQTEKDRRIKELEAQIIRMRNCQNCNNQGEDWYGNFCCKINKSAWDCDSWEMEK